MRRYGIAQQSVPTQQTREWRAGRRGLAAARQKTSERPVSQRTRKGALELGIDNVLSGNGKQTLETTGSRRSAEKSKGIFNRRQKGRDPARVRVSVVSVGGCSLDAQAQEVAVAVS